MAAEFLILGWTTASQNYLDLSIFEISSQGVTKRRKLDSRWAFTLGASIYADPKLENIWVHHKNKLYCIRCNGERQDVNDFQYQGHIEGHNIRFKYIL
ncbi:MAG: hypothetical protein ACPHA0_05225, partial [Candidatus Poseidoniaceae archaeon]